jgi:hypothetical protein
MNPCPPRPRSHWGFYLHFRKELNKDHASAYAATLAQLCELYPEMSEPQAKAICRSIAGM